MNQNEKETLLRQYASGEITWNSLRGKGIDSFREVLAGLGELGLRPPAAPMEGPNTETRQLGRQVVRQALKGAKPG